MMFLLWKQIRCNIFCIAICLNPRVTHTKTNIYAIFFCSKSKMTQGYPLVYLFHKQR